MRQSQSGACRRPSAYGPHGEESMTKNESVGRALRRQAPRERLAQLLRLARTTAGISQLEMSLRLGYSLRHIGFVERGLAKPGRNLLLDWLAEAAAPKSIIQAALLQAGYTAITGPPKADPSFWSVPSNNRQAIGALLRAHDPNPALVLDCNWFVVQTNGGFQNLLRHVGRSGLLQLPPEGRSLVEILIGEADLGRALVDCRGLALSLFYRLRTEAWANPELEGIATRLAGRLGIEAEWKPAANESHRIELDGPDGRLAFDRFQTIYGSPHEIAASHCRIESWYPSDERTRRAAARWFGESAHRCPQRGRHAI